MNFRSFTKAQTSEQQLLSPSKQKTAYQYESVASISFYFIVALSKNIFLH